MAFVFFSLSVPFFLRLTVFVYFTTVNKKLDFNEIVEKAKLSDLIQKTASKIKELITGLKNRLTRLRADVSTAFASAGEFSFDNFGAYMKKLGDSFSDLRKNPPAQKPEEKKEQTVAPFSVCPACGGKFDVDAINKEKNEAFKCEFCDTVFHKVPLSQIKNG